MLMNFQYLVICNWYIPGSKVVGRSLVPIELNCYRQPVLSNIHKSNIPLKRDFDLAISVMKEIAKSLAKILRNLN